MQNKEILIMVEILSNEKGLTKEQVFEALENAMVTAARKDLGKYNLKAKIDRKTGDYKLYRQWEVVSDNEENFDEMIHLYDDQATERFGRVCKEGEVIEEFVTDEPFGRQAAQVFKQSIKENLNKAQKVENQKNYLHQVGDVFLVTIKRFSKGDIIVGVNEDIEGILPRENVIGNERFKVGEKVNAVLYDVVDNFKGQQLVFDRASGEYIKALFKKEVSEVADENIVIESVARKAGVKTLILVRSLVPYVDALRECIGHKGMKVRVISENANGEPIGIVQAAKDDTETYLNVLSPVEPLSIYIDSDEKYVDVVLEEEDIVRVAGKTGLNLELMNNLLGMKFNLMTEEEFEEKRNKSDSFLVNNFMEKLNVDQDLAIVLIEEGFEDIESVAYAPSYVLLDIEGFDQEVVKELQAQAKKASEDEAVVNGFDQVTGLDVVTANKLKEAGISGKEELAELSVDELLDVVNIDKDKASSLIMEARKDWF